MTSNSAINLTKQDVEELLRPMLEVEDVQIEDISVRNLTKPGDNYGSTMLAVDVNLTPGPRLLPIVAKMIPKNVLLQEIFKCEITVRKEIDMYLLVRPAFDRIQKENNVSEDKYLDVLPVCYGARISSKGDSGPVDETSVILLENLKVQDFECGDRCNGLNLAHCKLVIEKLAHFHATAVAIKLKKPEEFKKTVLRAAVKVTVPDIDINSAESLETVSEYEIFKERIHSALQKGVAAFTSKNAPPPREPYATITHLDLWTNNIMFQYETGFPKEKPVGLKFVDFQITGYGSPAKDLLFFLYTSAELGVLSEYYEYLVHFYHDNFVDFLKLFDCDTTPFKFDEFLKEIEYASVEEFYHISFMLQPISASSEDAASTLDMTKEDIGKPQKFGKTYSDRARKFILDFASRNWI